MTLGVMHDLMKKLNESQEKALNKVVKQIAEENNVSEEVALYLISKTYNLKYDSEIKNANGEPQLILTFEPKSVDELLEASEDKTDLEKKLHKQFLEETC